MVPQEPRGFYRHLEILLKPPMAPTTGASFVNIHCYFYFLLGKIINKIKQSEKVNSHEGNEDKEITEDNDMDGEKDAVEDEKLPNVFELVLQFPESKFTQRVHSQTRFTELI